MTGCKGFVPGIFGATAWILGMLGCVWCKFLKFQQIDNTDAGTELHFGIWYYQWWEPYENINNDTVILEKCNNYPSEMDIDSKWKSARAFSTMALIIGGCVTFWVFFIPCGLSSKHIKATGVLLMLCCLFQGLALLLLNSNACKNNALVAELETQLLKSPDEGNVYKDECTLSKGANCTIAATVFWFLAAVVMCRINPPPHGPIPQQTQEAVEVVSTPVVVKGEQVPMDAKDSDPVDDTEAAQ